MHNLLNEDTSKLDSDKTGNVVHVEVIGTGEKL